MKRKDLKAIEGLTAEQIDAVLDLHQKDEDAHKKVLEEKDDTIKTMNTQVEDLRGKMKSFEGVDVEKMQEELDSWQNKFDTEIAKKDKQFAKEKLFANYKFSSNMAKKATMEDFEEKDLKFENGKFLGADDYFKSLKETDPDVFASEKNKSTGMEQGGHAGSEVDGVTKAMQELNPNLKF